MTTTLSKPIKIDTGGKAEIYTIENFATSGECAYIIDLIDNGAYKSQVVGDGENASVYSETRTSSSATLNISDPVISEINDRMHQVMPEWCDPKLSETPQGQRYEPGEQFQDHHDFFWPGDLKTFKHHIGTSGRRNWTFMLYLNDVEEGGETEFAKLGLKFKPKRGMGVIWRNLLPNNEGNQNTLHAGRPPVKGTKYIITKWFRNGIMPKELVEDTPLERPESIKSDTKPLASVTIDQGGQPKKLMDITDPSQISNIDFDIKTDELGNVTVTAKQIDHGPEYKNDSRGVNYIDQTFTSHDDFPIFTETGFKVIDVPAITWGIIQDAYRILKDKIQVEKGTEYHVYKQNKETASDLLSFDNLPNIRALIHNQLQPILEEWSGANIEKAWIYGIRSYRNGAVLREHKDLIETHHISAIILVDEKSNKPWPLDIQSHDGTWHKIYIKPGQMILYESTTCEHARFEEFDGDYFRNMFVHYKLKDWRYVGG